VDAQILTLAVGMPRTVRHGGRDVETGIFKSAVDGPLRVSLLNIAGDGQADLSVHGGRNKAVYAYPHRHYADWEEELGRGPLETAQFGENLTITGLDESNVVIGDCYRVGSVVAVVAQPRLPCFKLGIRMGDDAFPNRFLASGRLGFYFRIEEEGALAAGDGFERLGRPAHGITVRDLWQTVFRKEEARVAAADCLDALPYLDAGWIRRLSRPSVS